MHSFFGLGCTPSGYHLSKGWYFVHLKWHLFLFNFKFSWWHSCITFLRVLSWFLIWALCPTLTMWSSMPNRFVRSLKISLIFAGTCHLLAPCKRVVWWTCSCQIAMHMWLITRNSVEFQIVLMKWSWSICLLVWEICHLKLVHYALVLLMSD